MTIQYELSSSMFICLAIYKFTWDLEGVVSFIGREMNPKETMEIQLFSFSLIAVFNPKPF